MLKVTSRTVLIALAVTLAACSDGAVAPKNGNVANVSGGGALATLTQDTLHFSFTINPAVASSVYIGAGNSVHFPAGSVCDPASSYGTTEWENSCTPASASMTVNASAWLDGAGHPHVDFANHLRFVPTSVATQWVTITFTDTSAAQNPSSDILYCATTYSQCVSELSGDATLITVKNTVTSKVTRRIKHFSGYSIVIGDECTPTPDNPDCQEGGNGFSRIGRGLKLPSLSTASANIGVEGGVLTLESAGLTVVMPRGAVSTMTSMSVTARPGQLLSYQFEPHGTQFAVPLRVTQDLRGTDWANRSAGSMQVVYFANESQVIEALGLVVPSELLDVTIDAAGQASFNINHFSGYMFASGEACDASECGDGANASMIRVGAVNASLGRTFSAIKRKL